MFIIILTTIIFVTLVVLSVWNPRTNRIRVRKSVFFTPLVFLLLFTAAITKISANQVGIVYHPFQGGIQDEVLNEGFRVKNIFSTVTKIGTTNRTAFLEVAGQTKDSIYANFMLTIVYRIEAQNAGRFFKVTGDKDITPEQLNSITKEALQSATTNFDIYGILGEDLETVRLDFTQRLSNLLMTRYHITLVSASFDDIDAGSEIERIIQDKAQAIQQIQIAEQERQRAQVEAETAIIRATADAQVIIITAEAQAEAQIILNSVTVNAINQMYLGQFDDDQDTATPEVYGYLTIQEITQTILKQLYYDTWDGTLPTVIADGSGIIINP
ncbi:MAG: SPFH domain-containing protein [Candidatus Izemoplasmatales bacterium]|nr:SPFH domain-containing protein [Candidatus Izemoplasmatales bacterium]MDD5293464.1 SPFH domain-containing protein [Candidatus Izemoplasmatales bacterium]